MKILSYSIADVKKHARIKMHKHPFWQLDFYGNLKKNARIYCDDNIYEMDSSMAVLIPPYCKHRMEFKSSFRCCGIKFETDKSEFQDIGLSFIALKDHKHVFDILLEAGDTNTEIIGHALNILALRLKKGTEKYNARDRRIDRVLNFIDNNLLEKLDVFCLAEIAGLSVNHFIRLFKMETGLSPMRYVQEGKVKKASELLKYSDLPVSQIAYALDYSDIYSFSRSFKNISGVSPRSFRDKNRA